MMIIKREWFGWSNGTPFSRKKYLFYCYYVTTSHPHKLPSSRGLRAHKVALTIWILYNRLNDYCEQNDGYGALVQMQPEKFTYFQSRSLGNLRGSWVTRTFTYFVVCFAKKNKPNWKIFFFWIKMQMKCEVIKTNFK